PEAGHVITAGHHLIALLILGRTGSFAVDGTKGTFQFANVKFTPVDALADQEMNDPTSRSRLCRSSIQDRSPNEDKKSSTPSP
ncbi:MAG: hypothetical protein QOE68_406, partial [Thermoanaerobaculia bacterium]|nr:hypothetical protein [Thermoanaerobaculia bacterium]